MQLPEFAANSNIGNSPSILSDAWLAVQNSSSLYMGATWDWKSRNFTRDVSGEEASRALEELLPKASVFYPCIKDWKFSGAMTGVRAMPPLTTNNGSLPLLGSIDDFVTENGNHCPKVWLFGGLGSRGLLYHAMLGKLTAKAVILKEFCKKVKIRSWTLSQDIFNIFQATVSREARGIDEELRNITPCISEEMNDMLLRDISEEEIKEAMFSLGPLKAPSIDGFPALFYQRFWEKIKSSVVREVNVFWAEGRLNENINRTLITLIPKKKDAERIEDWRPISLCTVAVKIITKILASRLHHILDQVISPFQSAFIKGRIITDNFIVAHELAHFMKSIRDDKRFYASLKVDMSNAYDRVEWEFLKKLLLKMGFAAKWVDRIMECVCSVTYRVKVNDKVSSVIKPGRGLRQRDPISPICFCFVRSY
ncbi:hypothetical protein QQ045_031781 [Rhodiola kirilowii]